MRAKNLIIFIHICQKEKSIKKIKEKSPKKKSCAGCRPNRINPLKCELRKAGRNWRKTASKGLALFSTLWLLLFHFISLPTKVVSKENEKEVKEDDGKKWRKKARATWGLLMDRFQWWSSVISSCYYFRLAQMPILISNSSSAVKLSNEAIFSSTLWFFGCAKTDQWWRSFSVDIGHILIDCILMGTLCCLRLHFSNDLIWIFAVEQTVDDSIPLWSLNPDWNLFCCWFFFHFLQLASFSFFPFSFSFIWNVSTDLPTVCLFEVISLFHSVPC